LMGVVVGTRRGVALGKKIVRCPLSKRCVVYIDFSRRIVSNHSRVVCQVEFFAFSNFLWIG